MGEIIVNKTGYEIVVIGMGYVGLTYSLHINTFGYSVLGIETNEKTKNLINSRVLPFYEEGIEGRLNNYVKQGLLSVDNPEDFSKKQTVFPKIYVVTVGTPVTSNKINRSSLNKVFDFLNTNINDGDAIVLRSTVPIGFTTF